MFSKIFNQQETKDLLSISPAKTVEEILKQSNFSLADAAVLIKVAKNNWPLIIREAENRRQKQWAGKLFLVPPLYVTNFCADDCIYCGYRRSNRLQRQRLDQEDLLANVQFLISQGYRVIELVGATDRFYNPERTAEIIQLTKNELNKISGGWVGLNFFPFAKVADYKILVQAGLDFIICWQETYDPQTYKQIHPKGPKTDMNFRLNVFDRAIQGGVKNCCLAFLGGLYDWRYEVLSVITHGQYLEKIYGIPPFILGMPRYKGTGGDLLNGVQLSPYSNDDYLFVAAIYKLIFPNSLPWFSTREPFEFSAKAAKGGGALFTLDCSTSVGGYIQNGTPQFPVYSKSATQGIGWLKKQGFKPLHELPTKRR